MLSRKFLSKVVIDPSRPNTGESTMKLMNRVSGSLILEGP